MKDINILIVGVGGQGTLLASVILGGMALAEGYDVKLSEVHGMAQRGGSVVTHVRISENEIGSPSIDLGGADMVIAFELLEGYRWMPYLKESGSMFVNTQTINPMPVIMGREKYPGNIAEHMKEKVKKLVLVDALAAAEECGTSKAVNTVLLGTAAGELPFTQEMWIKQIEKTVKPKFIDINKMAFEKGRALAEENK